MFIGRDYELQELELLYQKSGFQMPVIYGRRRIGKSTLIREFTKGKPCIYYTAIEAGNARNLALFSKAIYKGVMPEKKNLPDFASYEDAFQFICEEAQTERLILVIDEYPYLVNSEKSIPSQLQRYIDEYFQHTQLFLILCGSSMSFMENQVLGYKSPLYGRRTAQFLIRPFDYKTSGRFTPSYTSADKAAVYGITGGVPKYLELIDPEKNLRQNIIDLFLKESGYLFEEPGNLLKQELREASSYNAVIEAIAAGATRVSEIAGKAKVDTSTATHCLEVLISLGIVSKEYAITEESNKRKTYYAIQDSMFRFWYRFVPGQIDAVLGREGTLLYDEVIEKELPMYMGKIFEQICGQYLMEASRRGQLPMKVLKLGRWWGNNPAKKREEEIDLIGLNLSRRQAIFGECKYRGEHLGKEVLEGLIEKAELLKGFDERFYILFSKSGFTSYVKQQASESKNILLVTLEEIYEKYPHEGDI